MIHCLKARLKRELSLFPAILCLLAIGFALLPAPARADTVIFDNVVGNCCGGPITQGANEVDGFVASAEGFTPSVAATLSSVSVEVLSVLGAGDSNFNILLYSSSGNLPGSPIATLGSDLTATSTGGLVTADGSVALAAGVEYWVVLTPYDANSAVAWENGGPTYNVPYSDTSNPSLASGWEGPGDTEDLQMEVTAASPASTPEPGTLVLVGSGLAGLSGLMRFRIRRAG
jgi:hypothetical protein